MPVKFSMIQSTTTAGDLPTDAANTYTTGINAPGGPVEYLILRGDMKFASDPAAADMSNLVTSIRIILNGEVVHDFRSGVAVTSNNTSGTYAAFLNAIGGRAYEVNGGTSTREFYWGIPIGRQTPAGVNRWEFVIEWAAAAAAINTPASLQFWLKLNDAMQTQTTIVPSTSFTHAVALEQVVVRVPQNVAGVVSAILVQNDSAADEFGGQGLRINALGDYGLEPSYWRWLNGDMQNGILYNDPALTTSQTIATAIPGVLMMPCFGLAGGDIVIQVDSSAVTTRTYTPVITQSIGAREAPDVHQTQAAPASTSGAILKRTEN